MNKKIDIGQNAKVCIVWNVAPTDYSKEKEKSIIALMATKYGIPTKNIKVEPRFINATGDSAIIAESVQNINEPKFQQELFKQYIIINKIEIIERLISIRIKFILIISD
jgi:hypothetical protein